MKNLDILTEPLLQYVLEAATLRKCLCFKEVDPHEMSPYRGGGVCVPQ